MFVVIYVFTVKPGMEAQFQEAWAERTKEIIHDHGSFGSRLHRADDGTFVAYAQWPTRQEWEDAPSGSTDAARRMKEALMSVETVFKLDVLNDLLVGDVPDFM
jgi:heme-degrading monooxygenase HmoA